jgi:hypothetical protein
MVYKGPKTWVCLLVFLPSVGQQESATCTLGSPQCSSIYLMHIRIIRVNTDTGVVECSARYLNNL